MNTIGRYQVESRIGAGSFATVYRAYDPLLDVRVAVKILAENWSANPDVRTRFIEEAKLLRRINDERIVGVHDIGVTDDDRPYFVMDYADGGSLEQFRRTGIEPGKALRYMAEAARAVETLHQRNIIHRDITPGNILLQYSAQGVRVMLADLGVAKSLTDLREGTMTAGTPAFMAYEQASGKVLDQRVDIYSLAAVTYTLLAGHTPFPIKTLNDILSRDWSVSVSPIAANLGAPEVLDDVLSRALSANPEWRPHSAYSMAEAFDSIADVLPGGNSLPGVPESPMGGGMHKVRYPAGGASDGSGGQGSGTPSPLAEGYGHYEGGVVTPLSGGSGVSYRPIATPASGHSRPLLAGDRPFAPRPQTGSMLGSSSLRDQMWGTQLGNQNPQQMLDSYLGKGQYHVKGAKERYSLTYKLLWAGGIVIAIVLVAIITITYLT